MPRRDLGLVVNKKDSRIPAIIQTLHWIENLWAPFKEYHALLGGAPGAAVSDVETVGSGRRVRYQNGTIYERPDGKCAWVYGAINERYDQLGGAMSWLGFPMADTNRH